MIDVSQTIKNYFLKDFNSNSSFYYNLQISFPNRDHSKINNDHIVKDSMSFTESICSDDILKFGLCEANVFRCVIDCPDNLAGKTIEVIIQLYYNGYEDRDLISLGQFTVDSCRKQSGSNLRELVAYGLGFASSNAVANDFERWKMALPYFDNSPYAVSLDMVSNAFMPDTYNDWNEEQSSMYRELTFESEDLSKVIEVQYDLYEISGTRSFLELNDMIRYNWTRNLFNYDNVMDIIKPLENIVEYKPTDFEKGINYEMKNLVFKGIKPFIQYYIDNNNETVFDDYYPLSISEKSSTKGMLYPNIGAKNRYAGAYNATLTLWIPKRVYISDHPTSKTYTIGSGEVEKRTFSNVDIDPESNLFTKIPRKNELIVAGRTFYYCDKADIVSVDDFISSNAELHGQFGKASRGRSYEFITICNTEEMFPSIELYPSNELFPVNGINNLTVDKAKYRIVDSEEFTTDKYGYVRVKYLGVDGSKYNLTVECDYTKPNVYEMNNNYIFLSKYWTPEQVTETIKELFYPNIKDVSYTPLNLEMKGLPFLEAGDTIRVRTSDGIISSVIMSRTLSGDQSLKDTIESQGIKRNENSEMWISKAGIPEKE